VSGGLGPTRAAERVPLLDVVRGFALFGILLANLGSFFGAYDLAPAERRALPLAAAGDATLFAIDWLVEGKFYSLFCLLFGAGFALQRQRAEQHGRLDFGAFFRRRTLVLAAIGFLHLTLLWAGDILFLYGVVGLLLPSLARLTPRAQLRAAAVLLALPLLAHGLIVASGGSIDPRAPFRPAAAWLQQRAGYSGVPIAEMKASAAWREVFTANLVVAVQRPGAYLEQGRPAKVLALFLLGAWLGTFVLPRLGEARAALRLTLAVGATLGLAASAVYALIKSTTGAWFLNSGLGLVQTAAYTLGTTPLALAYAAGLALLWPSAALARRLAFFEPLGRMALSVYLTQSLIQLALFSGYGLGLARRVPFVLLPAVAVAILFVQQRLCVAWLARFEQGPVEWAWRRFSYAA
jgi:uncharacterized protein